MESGPFVTCSQPRYGGGRHEGVNDCCFMFDFYQKSIYLLSKKWYNIHKCIFGGGAIK